MDSVLLQIEAEERERQRRAWVAWEIRMQRGPVLRVPCPVSHLGRSTRERHHDELLERCTLRALMDRRQP